MRRFLLISALLTLASPAFAGAMPKLPDMPPLPTHYRSVSDSDGFYIGILAGSSLSAATQGTVALTIGDTIAGADLLLGLEGTALVNGDGSTSLDASARLGVPIGDSLSVFGDAGLGGNSHTGVFATIGASVDFSLTDTVSLRAQYRFDRDLDGDPDKHLLLTGAVLRF